jgi:hypothetical protein
VEPAELGAAVFGALRASCECVPHPSVDELDHNFDAVLKLANAKSLLDFEKDAVDCTIELNDRELIATPSRRLGRNKGSEPASERAVRTSANSTPEQVGKLVYEALERCE